MRPGVHVYDRVVFAGDIFTLVVAVTTELDEGPGGLSLA
jgi:hypothetical protein